MVWYIFAFLFFILVDVLIFTQRWTWLMIALVSGGVFFLIALVLRGLFPDRKDAPLPAAAPQAYPGQPPAQPIGQVYQGIPPQQPQGYAQPAVQQPAQGAQPAVIEGNTRFGANQKQDSVAPAVFFYFELIVVAALVVFLLLKP